MYQRRVGWAGGKGGRGEGGGEGGGRGGGEGGGGGGGNWDQLGSSDGGGQEVEDGSEDGEGSDWRVGMRRLGREGGRSGAGPRAGSQVKGGCTRAVPTPTSRPRGASHPSPLAGGSCRCPIFCLLPLGIRFIL